MKLTREGKRFLLAALLIAVAAINTGNNLIYLILSLMLSFVLLSYLILRVNLAGLLLEVSAAGQVFAGEKVSIELRVQNNKKIPVYSVIIASPHAAEQISCGEISGQGAFRGRVEMVFRKRGLYAYGDFVVQSRFPFILFRKSISVHLYDQVLVYPKLLDIREIKEISSLALFVIEIPALNRLYLGYTRAPGKIMLMPVAGVKPSEGIVEQPIEDVLRALAIEARTVDEKPR